MKRYKATGNQAVFDHVPGESFDMDMNPDQEKFLLGISAISIVSNDPEHDKRFAENKAKAEEKPEEKPAEKAASHHSERSKGASKK